MKRNMFAIFLTAVVIFGFIIRIYQIDKIPSTLNVDEAALGYNAFSLLKTGADEHGVFMPFALKSFGDWKLPVYSYIDAPIIGLIDVSKLSVRLPSVLSGTISILLIYFVSFKLFKNKKIAIFSALFFAINPWSIFFSRAAYEINLGLGIFLAGLFLLLQFFDTKKIVFIFSAFILFGITMFTQHSFIVFTPLLVLAVLFLQRNNYKRDKFFYISIIFFAFIVLLSFVSLSLGGSKKASNLNVFNDQYIIYNRADNLRGDKSSSSQTLEKILYNKYYAGAYQFGVNYLNSFSPEFLFDKGGDKLQHNIGDTGYFYLIDALFIIAGALFLFWKREKKALMLIVPWIIIAPIPSAVTREESGTRLFQIMPALILVSSFGFYSLLTVFKDGRARWLTGLVLSLALGVSFIYFINYYFVHFNTQRIRFWKYGYEEAVQIAAKYPSFNVVMRGPENFPYIYFLFYDKYDPNKFRKEVKYYPETGEGFQYVKSFGRFSFVSSLQEVKEEPNTIYFDDQNFHKDDNLITLPNGDPVLKYYFGKISR